MDFDQGTTVQVWAVCSSSEDCDEMIAWLQLAKANIKRWEKIRAKASRAAKAAASKDENPQQGKILSSAPVAVGANGFDLGKAI